MESQKKGSKKELEKLARIDEKAIDLSGRLKCLRPCYISNYKVQEKVGGKHNPFHWMVNVAGYPFVNVAVQFRGKSGKYFQVQIRHHWGDSRTNMHIRDCQ